jgi:hypothetical protein
MHQWLRSWEYPDIFGTNVCGEYVPGLQRPEPLSDAIASRLVHKVYGLDRAWLYEGKREGLSAQIIQLLDEAEKAEPGKARKPDP